MVMAHLTTQGGDPISSEPNEPNSMRRFFLGLLVVLAFSAPKSLWATHIVGAELFYTCVDSVNSVYDIELRLYRDCFLGQAEFDNFVNLFVFDGETGLQVPGTPISIPRPSQTPQIQPDDWGPCVAQIPNICVEEGIYRTTITLPPNLNGYDLAWARCCRNSAITNLATPLAEGVSFLAHIPGRAKAVCNSMPTFDQVPPIFLCRDEVFAFDHSATDLDGDSLVYALTNPYTGINRSGQGAVNPNFNPGGSPVVEPNNNPMGPPPYQNVRFSNGYSFQDPFGSGNFTIDPQTGFITVTPRVEGIFVMSISVFEYRDGVLLSENRRDFQIHVIRCLPQGAPPEIEHDLTGTNHIGDTIFVEGGEPFCYDVTVTDPVPGGRLRTFPISAAFGQGSFFPPAATYLFSGPPAGPITGQVCWEPSCRYDGQKIPLIVGARDDTDCENVATVFDTVWIKITVPINDPPVITPNLTNLQTRGDTIVVTADEEFCFDFTVTDPNLGDSLTSSGISPIFNDPTNPPLLLLNGTNPLQGTICWTPACDLVGQIVELRIRADDSSACNPSLGVERSIWVEINLPPNDPPQITSDLTGNVFSNDTVFVSAESNFCFTFTATDPNTMDELVFIPVSTIFNQGQGPNITFSGTNPLEGEICWTPDCNFEGQVIPLVYEVIDNGNCNNELSDRDTVYISIQAPPNNPPTITSDLSGNLVDGDTIIVDANEGLCYTFQAVDADAGDSLQLTVVSAIFAQADGPTINFNGINPITGQVCWTPSCDFAGQVVELILEVADNGSCSSQANGRDTVYVKIDVPPNDPPVAVHNLTGLNSSGDTIFVDATEAFCYPVTITDPNAQDSLTFFTVSPIFSDSNAATVTVIGTNPLSIAVCWTPDCVNEGELVEFVLGARDNGACDNSQEVLDTVYVKISDPLTLPPVVDHDLTGNVTRGDTIFIEIGDSACYSFFVADLTRDNGVNYEFEFQRFDGAVLPFGTVDVQVRNDSILGEVCFLSSCGNGGSVYRSIIRGIDKETCPPFSVTEDTVYIKVNTDFLAFAGADTAFCQGTGGVQLNVTPLNGPSPFYYQWYCDDPGNCGFSPNPNVANPTVNPTKTTTYFVQVADRDGCTSEFDDIVVEVKELPIVDAGPDTFVCEGGLGTQLRCTILNPDAAPGPYTYEWTPAEGLSDPFVVDPYANPDTTTIYNVIVSSANGCSSTESNLTPLSTVQVEVRPVPIVEAGPDLDLCLADSAELKGFATNAGPSYEYIWTPSFGLNDTSLNRPLASPSATTEYFLVAWSNGCRGVADSATVTVRALPTVDGGDFYEVCGGDSVELKAIASGDLDATGYSFSWSPSIGLSDTTIAEPTASPPLTQTYQVTATSSFGCESLPVDVVVGVLPAPIVSLNADTSLCESDSLPLLGVIDIIGGALTEPLFYNWDPEGNVADPFVPVTYTRNPRTGLYILQARTGSCANKDSMFVQVFPGVTATALSDTNRICEGDTVQLLAEGGLGSETYQWLPPTGLDDPTISNPKAAPDTTTTYTVVVRENICQTSVEVPIIVNPGPVASYVSTQPIGCPDLTVYFQEQTENATSYVWDFGDGSAPSNEAAPFHTYAEPGTYPVTLTVYGTGGCVSSTVDVTVEVVDRGVARFSASVSENALMVLPNVLVDFTDQSIGAESYLWQFGDGGTSTEANPSHTYTEAGEYLVTLTITDAGGCLDTISFGPIRIIDPEIQVPNIFTPNADGKNDRFIIDYVGKSSFELLIFDRLGRPVFSGTTDPQEGWDGNTDEGQPATEGVYYYLLRIGDKSYNGNITLLR